MLHSRHLSLCILLLLNFVVALAQPPRGLQIADLSGLKEVADAQISPDGKMIAFTVGEITADRAWSVTHIWLVATQGEGIRRLTKDEANESTPRWSPDGKCIAFYSDRDKQNGLWIAMLNSEAPVLVAHSFRTNFYLTHAGESFTWAPDSKRIAFLSSPEVLADSARSNTNGAGKSSVNADSINIPEQIRRPLTREEIEKLPTEVREMILRLQGQTTPLPNNTSINGAEPSSPDIAGFLSKSAEDPRVVSRLQYKSRTAFSDTLQSHLFIADLSNSQLQQITFGNAYEHSINWSPNGNEIVFVANREPDPDKVNNTDLFTVNVNTRQLRQLTRTKGCEWTPFFSPDGKDIAFTATKREVTTIDSVAEDTHLFLISTAGGEVRELNKEQDRRVYSIHWSHDGNLILFTASDHGKTLLFQATQLGAVRQLFDYEAQISSFSVGNDGTLAMTISDPTHPAEVYATRTPGKFEPVTKLHQNWLGTFQPAIPREFTFKHEGLEIQGWLYPPSALNESKKYPVVLSIHGGPHGMHGYAFNITAQSLAARGYGVVLLNPRGSSGYGQTFSDGCINDWGGGDYRDLMKGLDEALSRFTFLDKSNIGVMGGSYGGYMTNWIVTQTERFKAAVTSASLSNLISFYSTSLYQDLILAEFKGYPWENYDLLWERSPLKHIKKVKTPTLIVHGEQDHDVHITQAEELYTTLRMRGVETVFIRYPREGHGIREPQHRDDQLARTILWFDRFLKPQNNSSK
ncbi:MAG: S9 family peptidase [Acidobacteria bacterium]|nr:S9 family peptidase [Acidobacteriota bacterium]